MLKSDRKRKCADIRNSPIKKIKNQETFAYGTHVAEIPPNQLLILDGYAFDIEELNSLSEKDLFTNMHTQTEFSQEAKNILLSNKFLEEKAKRNLPKVQVFPQALLADVYNLGITLFQKRARKNDNPFKHAS